MTGCRLYALFVLFMSVGTASAAAAAAAQPPLVVNLDVKNFKQEVESSTHEGEGIVFVEFYAPWCGHCKKLLPELEEAAKQLRKSPGVKIAKMDADRAENKGIAKRFGVKGFPSLKVFKRGKLFADYGRGGRTSRHIVSYLRRLQTPAVVALAASGDEVGAFTSGGNGDHPVYVLLGGGVRAAKTFAAVAETAREHTWFGHVKLDDKGKDKATAADGVPSDVPSDVAAALGLGVEQLRRLRLPALVAVHETTGAEVYAGNVEAKDTAAAVTAVTTFVNHTRLPVVVRLEQAVFPVVAHSPRPAVLLLVSGGAPPDDGQIKASAPTPTPMTAAERDVARRFLDVAKVHRDAAHFATVDMFLLGPWVKHELGLEPGKGGVRLPAVMVFHKKNHSMWFDPRWRERGNNVDEALESLLRDAVYEKTLAPTYLKTAPMMYKLEREIEKRPNIAVAIAAVPVFFVLGGLLFKSLVGGTGGGGAGGGGGSGGGGGEKSGAGQRGKVIKSGAAATSGAANVRQRR